MAARESRILAGKGLFVDDLQGPNMAHGIFVGSPYAHARIQSIDVRPALPRPGVLAVLTGEDLVRLTEPLPPTADFSGPGRTWRVSKVYPLAVDKVRFQGEPVAMVIAETLTQALDAADLIRVVYEPLAAVVDAKAALEGGSPLVYEEWGDNIQLHIEYKYGEPEEAFAEADRVLRVSWQEGRVSGFPLEARGCLANFDPLTESLSVWGSFQCPFRAQHTIAQVLRMQQSQVRVTASDIGGAFGNKINNWKYTVVCLASKILGRPVKWREGTRESFLTGPHQRDVIWECEAAVKNDGRILGIRGRFIQNLGVEISHRDYAGPSVHAAVSSAANAYRLRGMQIDAFGVVTNKSFYGAYRGFGKDKGIKLMERIMDQAARECGIDPAEVRLRNFIQPEEFPYKQISGLVYDSGDYPALWRQTVKLAEVEKWRAEQAELRKKGRYLGIGWAFVVEPAGIAAFNARYSGLAQARVKITGDGFVEVYSDRTEIGQGAEQTNAKVIAEILGAKIEDILIKPVTSDIIGMGPVSSRGAVYSLSAVAKAAKQLRQTIVKLACACFEETPENIRMADGVIFSARDPRQRMTYREMVDRMYFRPGPRGLPKEMQLNHETLLDVTASWFSPNSAENPSTTYTTFSAAGDIAVVEVDPETGETKVLKYVHAHDAGRMVSREVVDGQIRGGIVQGIGEALSEEVVYHPNGDLANPSYADFVMPSALDGPEEIVIHHLETPSPYTELGTKGMGESPIISAKAVIISAIEDALSPFGIRIAESPATRERVSRWVRQSRESASGG